ncbi:MAG: hypothetical protein IPF81_14320 [Bacteroidetes bacterium]|nr:hypothetical protein [Bacteroidota bacterium]
MDVTPIVQEMVSDQAMNYGFLLKLTNETFYAQLIFASGDNPNDLEKHPLFKSPILYRFKSVRHLNFLLPMKMRPLMILM